MDNSWQHMDTAPKGNGDKVDFISDPNWIEPPKILIFFQSGDIAICYWEWYYAEGGQGCNNLTAWVSQENGEQAELLYDKPLAWKPLPEPPNSELLAFFGFNDTKKSP